MHGRNFAGRAQPGHHDQRTKKNRDSLGVITLTTRIDHANTRRIRQFPPGVKKGDL
jgi:hypothetical protein